MLLNMRYAEHFSMRLLALISTYISGYRCVEFFLCRIRILMAAHIQKNSIKCQNCSSFDAPPSCLPVWFFSHELI